MPQAVQTVSFIASILTVLGVLYLVIKTWNMLENKTTQHDKELHEIREWIRGHKTCDENHRRILEEVGQNIAYLKGKASERRYRDGTFRDIERERRDSDE